MNKKINNFFEILTKGILWLLEALPKRKEEEKSKSINKTNSKEKNPEANKQELLKNTKIDSKQISKVLV